MSETISGGPELGPDPQANNKSGSSPENRESGSSSDHGIGELGPLSSASLAGDPGSESRVVTARGTEDGLVLRIDGKAEWSEILQDIELFLGGRKKFFSGGQVSLEWLDRLPSLEQSKTLEDLLHNEYGIELVVKRKRPSRLALAGAQAAAVEAAAAVLARRSGLGSLDPNGSVTGGFGITGAGEPGSEGHGKGAASGEIMTSRGRRTGVTINLFEEVEESSKTSESGLAGPSIAGPSLSDSMEIQASNHGSSERGFSEGSFSEGPFAGSQWNSMPFSAAAGAGGEFNFSDSELGGTSGTRKVAGRMAKMLGDDLFYEDDANAKVFFGTLRSGQRLETPFSLIVVGDVNPGADLVAGGDIIVFGGLRGTAHASAYDDDALDRVIIALQMQPMQLRIGSVISRGSDELVRGAEIARIENRRIIVEAFNPRALSGGTGTGGGGTAIFGKKFR